MEVGLAEISSLRNDRSQQVTDLSDALTHFFADKNCGDGIKMFTIGIICIGPEFTLFKKKEPRVRYTRGKKSMVVHGVPFEIEDSFEYSISIDHDAFVSAPTKLEAQKVIASAIWSSLNVLDRWKRKIPDVDLDLLKLYFYLFFKLNELIE
ncbi:hypothetical protein GCM10023093_14340 [Nemorincola caseinilytica]|uniref:Uncharacterized protein n=1 Tax=Nemorincola caseinilytica TaxID=2054315 RepID=A0ABP8NF93_9BACT